MNEQIVARGLLVGFCALQGITTAAIDLNRTHASNPQWAGHARFHVVWQTASVVLLAAVEVALVLAPGGLRDERFYCAAILAAVPMFGFFCALLSRRIFGSTLSDPNGMKPLIIRAGGSNLRIDLNLVAEICGVLALAIIVAIYAHANRA